jgi:hypothetical protein
VVEFSIVGNALAESCLRKRENQPEESRLEKATRDQKENMWMLKPREKSKLSRTWMLCSMTGWSRA